MRTTDPKTTDKTPRPDSKDTLFFSIRACFLAGAVIWAVAVVSQIQTLENLAADMISGILPPLLWFLLYSVLFFELIRRFPRHRSLCYHMMMILDVVFVTLMVRATGHGNSDFYLGYYLFIAAHTLSFGARSGAAATILSSVFYLILYFNNASRSFAGDFGMRTAFMFLVYFMVATITEKEKQDKIRLEQKNRRIDELNRKFERSNNELIEKNDSLAQAIREKERMNQHKDDIIARVRMHSIFLREMNSKNTIEDLVLHFSRYVSELLHADNVDMVTIDAEHRECMKYQCMDNRLQAATLDYHHPILEAIRNSPERSVEWRVDKKGIPTEMVMVDYEPALVRAEPVMAHTVDRGVFIITHSEPFDFDQQLMDEIRILSNNLGEAMQNLRYRIRLQELAETDGLTGVYNRRYFQERLDQELMRANRYKRPMSLILFDIDHFKKFNDSYGHLVGDAVLRELARVVGGRLRNIDILARYGGEEFIIILPETPKEGAAELSERLRAMVESHPFPYNGGQPLTVTISMGVGAFPEVKEKEALIKATDDALYRAKEGGRNKVCQAE